MTVFQCFTHSYLSTTAKAAAAKKEEAAKAAAAKKEEGELTNVRKWYQIPRIPFGYRRWMKHI